MNTRDIAKLQYQKGQQIKAEDVNDQMKLVFSRFNDMGPTDTMPLTTGQFRVFEPTIGFKIVLDLLVGNNWITGNNAAINATTFDLLAAGDPEWYIVANGAAVEYAFLTVGHRYTAYMKFDTTVAGAGVSTIGLYNGVDTTTSLVVAEMSVSGTTTNNVIFGTFVAEDTHFCIGGHRTSGLAMTVQVINNTLFDASDVAVYIFDWTDNRWIIPNYDGFVYPPTQGVVPTIGGGIVGRRENHALICQAIRKEIQAANEVLNYLQEN